MKQKDIYDEIAEAVGRKMGDNFVVELHEVIKENDNVQHGLVIRDNAKSVAPVLYLDQMVEELGQLMPAEVMADKIILMYEEIGEPPIEMEGFSLEWEDIKDNLELHVAGLKLNRERLKDALYLPAGNGLVLVPYVRVAEAGDGYMQCMITREMADKEGYDLRELFGQAMENTVEKYPPVFGDLTDLMLNLSTDRETDPRSEDFALPEEEGMLVLTTEDGVNGATALFYPEVQERIGMILGKNYYVIPSSTHEVMIAPEHADLDPAYLQEVLRNCNRSVVAPEEVLSNNVLIYNTKMRDLTEIRVQERAGEERGER